MLAQLGEQRPLGGVEVGHRGHPRRASRGSPGASSVGGLPAQLALGLGVGGAAHLQRRVGRVAAGDEAREPDRDAPRALGAERLGVDRHPLAHRRRLVVDDVVDAGGAALERGHRRRRRVVDVDEGEGAGALADHRQPALHHFLGLLTAAVVVGAGPVEPAVAEDDALDALGGEDLPLEVGHRLECRPEAAGGVVEQRRLLVLDPAALRPVGEGDALGDDAPRARRPRRGDQVARPLDPDPVGRRQVVALRVVSRRQRGEKVDDRGGSRGGDRGGQPIGVEDVADDRGGAGGADLLGALLAARHPGHLVAGGEQPAHQRPADRAAGSGDEDPHR